MHSSVSTLLAVPFLALVSLARPSLACDCSQVDPAAASALAAGSWDDAVRLVDTAIARDDSAAAHRCRARILLGKAAREAVRLDLPALGLPEDWVGTVELKDQAMVDRLVHSRTELDPALAAQALAELDLAIARQPADPRAHRCALEVAQTRGDHAGFLRALERAATRLQPLGPEAAVDELLPYPKRYADEKRYDRASDAYRLLLDVYPASEKLHSSYGVVLLLQGDLDGAVERFARAFELNPHDLLVLGNSANAALYKRDFSGARRYYELFLQESPEATAKYFDLAAIALQRGAAASLPAWKRYLERHALVPDDAQWAELAADIVKQLERSTSPRDLDEIAQRLIAAGAPAQAIPALAGAAEREPGDPVHPFLLAHAYERGGLPALALAEVRRSQRLLEADPLLETPSRPAVAYELGRLALVVNQVELAVPHLEYAAREQPDHGDSQYALGLAYQRSGRTEEAHAAFERCLTAARPSPYREFCRKYFGETAPPVVPTAPGDPSN